MDSQDILDNISTGIIALDADLAVTAINSAGEALLKLSEARTLGLHASQLLTQNEDWLECLEQARAEATPIVRRGMNLQLLGGEMIQVDLVITPIMGDPALEGLLLELQPVDRLLRISREESLLHAQETTRAVIRGLAHEIKNPLGGVRGAAQLLARELPDEGLVEYTGIIIREADRLRDLVDRLLGPDRQPSMARVNIHEILEHVRNLVCVEADQPDIVIRDYDPSLPDITGDRSQLIQALLNITRNALQAAPDIGKCRIELRTRSQRQFTIGTQRHRLVCRVDIVDNGPGIPDDMQQAIFIPMVTGRAEGTGLGLSISQSIINRHGGLLECNSEPGATRFTIYLPMEDSNA
jgi:two-component system nitrogen regulation sensor histidine kinase GlnL